MRSTTSSLLGSLIARTFSTGPSVVERRLFHRFSPHVGNLVYGWPAAATSLGHSGSQVLVHSVRVICGVLYRTKRSLLTATHQGGVSIRRFYLRKLTRSCPRSARWLRLHSVKSTVPFEYRFATVDVLPSVIKFTVFDGQKRMYCINIAH